MKYKHIFFDLDHTLWDFDANAKNTLQQLHLDLRLAERGIDDFELFYTNYLLHNDKLWARYRKGFIKQEELRVKRMWLCLLDFKIADDELAREMNDLFLQLLSTRTVLFPHTVEILQYLKDKKYYIHLITNGFEDVQHRKLESSGIKTFFHEVVTSERSNSLKPNKEIFEFAMDKSGANISDSIMIGDSLEVDIAGAINIGMDQVHANFRNEEDEKIKPTYTITSLRELEGIL
jgi:putative hydrolase of the HAD superfamily